MINKGHSVDYDSTGRLSENESEITSKHINFSLFSEIRLTGPMIITIRSIIIVTTVKKKSM